MAGYSQKPLVSKLDIKPSHRILIQAAPSGFEKLLKPLPDGATLVGARSRQADCILFFANRAADLRRGFAALAARLPPAGLLWVAWPKKAARIETDLTEDVVRRIGLDGGLVDVKVCAITEVWSGLKFVRRLRDR